MRGRMKWTGKGPIHSPAFSRKVTNTEPKQKTNKNQAPKTSKTQKTKKKTHNTPKPKHNTNKTKAVWQVPRHWSHQHWVIRVWATHREQKIWYEPRKGLRCSLQCCPNQVEPFFGPWYRCRPWEETTCQKYEWHSSHCSFGFVSHTSDSIILDGQRRRWHPSGVAPPEWAPYQHPMRRRSAAVPWSRSICVSRKTTKLNGSGAASFQSQLRRNCVGFDNGWCEGILEHWKTCVPRNPCECSGLGSRNSQGTLCRGNLKKIWPPTPKAWKGRPLSTHKIQTNGSMTSNTQPMSMAQNAQSPWICAKWHSYCQ